MAIILDLAILGIIVLFGILAAKKGFAKTLIDFVGLILAIVLSVTLSSAAANVVYDKFIEPPITKQIAETIEETAHTGTADIVSSIWDKLPNVVRNLTENQGLGKAELEDTVNESMISSTEGAIEKISQTATQKIVKPIVKPIISFVIGIILFIALTIAIKFLSTIVNKIFSIRLLGTLNKSLGFVIGLLKGAVIAVIVVIILSSSVYLSNGPILGISTETIDSTIIFKYITNFNPLIK